MGAIVVAKLVKHRTFTSETPVPVPWWMYCIALYYTVDLLFLDTVDEDVHVFLIVSFLLHFYYWLTQILC